MSQKAGEFRVPWSGKGHEYSEEEIQAVVSAMREADPLTQGRYQAEFERKLSAMHGGVRCFALATATAALELSAMLCRLRPDDEVILPAHTFAATAIPFGRTGAKLVWADIDPKTFIVTAETIRPLITARTKVIIVVHLYGLVADMDPILELAQKHGIKIVEDAAQVIGARYKGRPAGTLGDFGVFSFHSHKNMTTLGEGGALAVRDHELAKLVPGLRHNGTRPYPEPRDRYWIPAMGDVDLDLDGVWPYNFCIGEVQCALGSKLLDRLPAMNADRQRRAKHIIGALADFPELQFQASTVGSDHIYHLLTTKFVPTSNGMTRDGFLELLAFEYGVKAVVQYYPLYRYPMFKKMGFGEARCPNTDSYFDNMVSLPFQHWLTDAQVETMIGSIKSALETLRKKHA